MRVLSIVACAAVLAVGGTACTKSADTSTGTAADSSATAAAAAATAAAAAATAAAAAGTAAAAAAPAGGGDTDAKTHLPLYPGATQQASGETNGQAGTALTTSDAFDKVYEWYKSKMPAGSEKAKLSAGGMDTATFQVDGSDGKGTVAITSQGGKTSIALALTK